MSERLKSYFRHYRSERRGVIVFLSILLLIIIGSEVRLAYFKPDPEPFHILLISEAEAQHSEMKAGPEDEIAPFRFNPNTLNDSGYLALGFSEREIAILRNYQKAGGRFEVKSDFSKLYFVDEGEFRRLLPFINLPDSINTEKKKKARFFNTYQSKQAWSDTADTTGYRYTPFVCNINTADTNELKRLNGIGSFYARKIVEYRDELGGFHSLSQLLELWKMTPEKIDGFAENVVIRRKDLIKIPINRVTAHSLSRHPYVSFELANEIVLKREERSGFSSSDDLCSSGLLDAELCRKLVPYLNFDP